MKLQELLYIWSNKYTKYRTKLKTQITYQKTIDNHLIPILGEYELKELSSSILQDFINLKFEKGNIKNGMPLSYNSVLSIFSVLKQALIYAYELELLEKDITKKIILPRGKEKKIEIFNKQEQQMLESYCITGKKNYIGIVLCLYTGIRIGELLALTWEDINFEDNLLSINKNVCTIKINGKTTIHIDEPKTKSSTRIIPIPKQLMPKLKKLKKSSSSIYVITTKNNTMVGTRSYQRTFARILKKLNIKELNFHALRHTFATRALEIGTDVKSLSEILGHKDPSITLNRYTHSNMEHKSEMINKLGKNIKN